ncbi:MAG: hypothetical protein O7B81_10955 [Gammaproteobacteria bacterium]|nr:hypothetical protein [Gammaproteobacteria bacterium]
MASIEILAPKLLDAIRRTGAFGDTSALNMARSLLTADRIAGDGLDFEAAVLRLFGMNDTTGGAPALAGVTAAYDFDLDEVPVDLLRADPVFLRPDPTRLILFDAETIDLNGTEADTLIALLNRAFEGDGLQFKRGRSATRWYVNATDITETRTRSTRSLRGQAIEPQLDDLRRIGRFNRVMTEAQMVLHEADVNIAREAAGKQPINSLWFWGLGKPPERTAPRTRSVVGDELVAACARYCGVEYHRILDLARADAFDSGALTIVCELDTETSGLDAFLREAFQPALAALAARRVDAVRIRTRSDKFFLTRRTPWRFWRRFRSLDAILQERIETVGGGGGAP